MQLMDCLRYCVRSQQLKASVFLRTARWKHWCLFAAILFGLWVVVHVSYAHKIEKTAEKRYENTLHNISNVNQILLCYAVRKIIRMTEKDMHSFYAVDRLPLGLWMQNVIDNIVEFNLRDWYVHLGQRLENDVCRRKTRRKVVLVHVHQEDKLCGN